MKGQTTEGFGGSETNLYDTTVMDTCNYTLVKTQNTPRVNFNANYGL